LIKIIIKEEHFKWHLEAFASELFILFFLTNILNIGASLLKVNYVFLGELPLLRGETTSEEAILSSVYQNKNLSYENSQR